ncbi:MAG: phosphomannomutase/phosphoglucomutase [Magnetococcales bacterium]|nr:phosphomannomutase/phosphoglucomutase [Magnetococcales bacterium]
MINPYIFREYDIRGVAGKDLTREVVENLGTVFAQHVRENSPSQGTISVAMGRDGRASSPELAEALGAGLAKGGAEVIDVGLIPTPGLYYATHHFNTNAAIMLTGSHNPPDYNGLKMVREGRPVYGDEIQTLKERLLDGQARQAPGGSIRQEPILQSYLDRLVEDFQPGRPLKVIFDCGNGVAGVAAPGLLAKLPNVTGEVLFAEVDGTFPNHHPDPTVEKNLAHLKARVAETGADVGIAYDGDGDRIGAVDEAGRVIWGDRMMILFARAILKKKPGATVIGDVKCSQLLFDAVNAAGGEAIMWKTGHSLVKAKMKETGAAVGGEMSGHLFFADRYYGFDDALYAAVRLIELLAAETSPLSARLTDLPQVYATPELRLFCEDERKFQVMERIASQQKAAGADLSDVDGIRVRLPDGWWLLRVSNTQPALVARVEAQSREKLQEIAKTVEKILAAEGVEFPEWQEA